MCRAIAINNTERYPRRNKEQFQGGEKDLMYPREGELLGCGCIMGLCIWTLFHNIACISSCWVCKNDPRKYWPWRYLSSHFQCVFVWMLVHLSVRVPLHLCGCACRGRKLMLGIFISLPIRSPSCCSDRFSYRPWRAPVGLTDRQVASRLISFSCSVLQF